MSRSGISTSILFLTGLCDGGMIFTRVMQIQDNKENKHTCEAVVLHCIDFRFQQAMNEHFDVEFPKSYDLVSIAGGVKELVEKGRDSFLLNQIQLSLKFHQPQNIVLVQHEDCGAYGGSESFENSETEFSFQRKQLQKAEELLKEQFPKCIIQKCFARLPSLSGRQADGQANLSGEITQV